MPYDPSVDSLTPSKESLFAISVMLRYIRNELSKEEREKVAKAITNCKSCNRLHHEVSSMFNPLKIQAYELEYKEEIERTDRLFQDVYDFYEPLPPSAQSLTKKKIPQKHIEQITEDCIGCGA